MTDIGSLLRTSVIVFFYHADGADSTGLITVWENKIQGHFKIFSRI